MALSGTTNFNPPFADYGAFALGRCKIRRPQITSDNLADVAMAGNLVFSDWSVDQPNLWAVTLAQISLAQGTATYTLPHNVLQVLDCYITTTVGGMPNNRIIYGVSRSEFAAYPNPAMQAFPTVYWYDRVVPGTLNLYPTPDGNGPYTLNYYAVIQDDDAVLGNAATINAPYRMMSAFTDALAAKLALTYAPDMFEVLDKVAERSYARARRNENENVPIYITPGLTGYYR